ncbi:MAG: molybdopterin-dependent oxidoreductase [Eggerthellaceae bacterium]|nr:molybdopterin-dependent oxidoreductase [Eggerthellaceae bacterium]
MRGEVKKASAAKGSKRKLTALVVATAVALTLVAVFGCAPKSPDPQPTPAPAPAPAPDSTPASYGYPNFMDNSSGIYPDTYYNRELLNTGNRGCNSCHTDLFDVFNLNEDGYQHILVSSGYGKNATIKDCEPCHRTHMDLTGMYLGDIIHASHYSNETFIASNGNCWSCHAVNGDGSPQAPFELCLYDDIADTAALGGYPGAVDNPAIRDWLESRGFPTGLVTGISVEAKPAITVKFDQRITDESDVFLVDNWGYDISDKGANKDNRYRAPGETGGFDLHKCCDPANGVTITGVNKPMTFTKADLEKMPQTTFSTHISCGTNGNGGCLTANTEFTGVSMEYILDLCGGLADGNNAVLVRSYDGWIAMGIPLTADIYTHDAFLVTKAYGKDLTEALGAPIMVVSKSGAGVTNVKHIEEINFVQADEPFTMPGQLMVNGFWFQNDGQTFKAGETVNISCAVYAFSRQCGFITTVRFSFDQGMTWIDYDVASNIPGYDPYQWVCADIQWKPAGPGTYCVLAQAVTDQGVAMDDPIALRLVVK